MRNFLRGAQEGLKRLVITAEQLGWSASRTAGGHVKFSKPGRLPIFTSFTASDCHSALNALARLRRADVQAAQSSCQEII
ncbi:MULTISPECIES: hypothetical protein [Pseudomonas]|uniref:hypothetical protein n=1 Tax=Pseudomonas TaxID=286 RepID=UPI0004D55353|nr:MULTISPECIES: hypothetical protein [Pseudomonas]KES20026.1 hypothetical protein FG99_01350 [Pseudomonas sp. AAC]MDU4251730.1 type II toxin-antitoxin system HicA family toxin [Pseudomonas sp.]NMZ77242.1 type II toxin-antitoxin system HicA family toxin [Pseudomonas nitroreducens]OBY48745.1 hypothetical protein A9513_033220 [Pseudomonas sp. AU12215]OHR78490.1 hypothetical protein HMPREF3289_02895 [Pseudomonas sp. HMSC75E02]